MKLNEVVITGMGVVSPIGTGLASFTSSLKAGRVPFLVRRQFDGPKPWSQDVLPLEDFAPPKYAAILDPYIQYILKATEEAIQASGLDFNAIDLSRVGITVSSSKGGVHTFDRFYGRFQRNPSALLGARVYANFLPNIGAQWVARRWKITGPAKTAVAACATGLFAIMEGIRMVEQGDADYCIAGAGDASITPLMIAGYRQLGVLSAGTMRPYDKRRDGFMLGEGAGIVILENAEHARTRKAKVYGRVVSHAYGFEGSHSVKFSDKGEGLKRCLEQTLKRVKLTPRDLHYLNLHGTATQDGDRYETAQIKQAFGKEAYKIPMSSTKSMTGHMVGASGAVEVIAALLAAEEGFVPPTMGLEAKDPECDLDYTPRASRKQKVDLAASISLGFGGQLGAIILGRS